MGADALAWARRALEEPLAWLWVLLLPSILLHYPAQGATTSSAPLPHAARAAAVFSGDFSSALADRDAGVWRSAIRTAGKGWPLGAGRAAAPDAPGRVKASQRRSLLLVRDGRLSAATRAPTAAPVEPRTTAVWDKACSLFPPARPGLATTESLEADFPGALAAAVDFARSAGVPDDLHREAVADAIRRAPRSSAFGPSGLQMEHLRAFGEDGQAALAGLVLLLGSADGESLVPPLAADALAGADLLLICKPGGLDTDGLPRLRPIGMPDQLRMLAAAALAVTVRAAAARLLSPLHMGVGFPNPCERVVHEVSAVLAHNPRTAFLQLDIRNAFNLVSRSAAVAFLTRAFPLLWPCLSTVYLGFSPPRVYSWALGAAGAGSGAPGVPLSRRWLAVEQGVQQGDPLDPLLHAAAMHLAVLRVAAADPSAVVRAVHDDFFVFVVLEDLPAILRTAAAAGAAVDAKLAPSKCAGWSLGGAVAPVGWPALWRGDGVRKLSVPLGSEAIMTAAVDDLDADHYRLTEAIVSLPRSELPSQLLLLRLCAGPQPNYCLRALPLTWSARLAASVDRAARGGLRRLLTDARDAPAAVDALLARATLPLA